MKKDFMRAMMRLGAEDSRVNLVVGDIGFATVEPFAEKFPKQFLNAGVAEQNMTGIAAGLALSGRIVYTYSIANFPIIRCLEQVRNDVCYHNANVKIASIGCGLSYGSLGMTHHATEDLAIMRSLPAMTVLAPGDPIEAELATAAAAHTPGPCFLRLGRSGEPSVHAGTPEFHVGKAIRVREGADITLISTGAILGIVMDAAEALAKQGIHSRVLSMHTVKPLDEEAIRSAARETRAVITVEEHSVLGGLGGAVAEVLAEFDECKARFRRIGLPSQFTTIIGTQDYLREVLGLSPRAIAECAQQVLKTECREMTASRSR
jgi:transketolase